MTESVGDGREVEIPEAGNDGCAPLYDLFICYRRVYSAHAAFALHKTLVEAFDEVVFIDHQSLSSDDRWRQRIEEVVAHADTMVVLLTADWLDEFTRRAEAHQDDEVLRELRIALRHRKRLIPILLDEARAPTHADARNLKAYGEFSAVVHALAEVHALPWRSTSHESDLATIIDAVSIRLPRFGERLRHRCRERLARQFEGSEGGDHRRWEKLTAFRDAIERPGLERSIDEAWARQPALLVIHAEEGMGKTIALARMLRSIGDETAVLLSDASETAWKDGFVSGCKKLLAEQYSEKGVTLALEQSLTVAIDGLNEAPHIPWSERLTEALEVHDASKGLRVVVTVRSAYWQETIAPCIRHPGIKSVAVPALDDAEFQALASKLGFSWQNVTADVRGQLRKPRMLAAAARIPPEQLDGKELSYSLLQLLDLRQRGSGYRHLCFERFTTILKELGQKERNKRSATRRSELRDLFGDLSDSAFDEGLRELCDAGVLLRVSGKFAVHEGATNVALGLHLLHTLRELDLSDVATLKERIRAELADQQDDSTARIVANAITVVVFERVDGEGLELDAHDPVLVALLADWLDRYNADDAPARQARWLVPELLWLAENRQYRDVEALLAHVLGSATASPWESTLLQKLGQWLLLVEIEEEFTEENEEVRQRLQMARAIAPLREAGHGKARLRRIGLDIAAKAALPPTAISLLGPILSVAVQPDNGWDSMRRWVASSDADWWPALAPIWRRVSEDGADTPLLTEVGRLLRYLWPTPECLATIPAPPRPRADPRLSLPDLTRLSCLVQHRAQPTAEQMDRLLRETEPGRADRRGVRNLAAALALWFPDRLQQAVDLWADQAASDSDHRESFEGAGLVEFAPLVRPASARRLRAAIPRRYDSGESDPQVGYLSMVSWWMLSPARRIATVLRHLSVVDLDKEVLCAAPVDAGCASVLLQRAARESDPLASRIVFWLYWTLTHENATTLLSDMQSTLPETLNAVLGKAGQYWLLRLGLDLNASGLASQLVSADWCYEPDGDNYIRINYARSAALAETGELSAEEARERCHPDHWHLASCQDREHWIADRALALYERFVSDQYRPSYRDLNQGPMQEMAQRHPDVVERVLSTLDHWREDRAQALAMALPPDEHPRWIDLVECFADSPRASGMIIDGIDQRLLVAFRAPDTERARAIWDRMLTAVEHDADLMQLVVAARKGNGQQWLRERSIVNPTATPHQQLRSAMLAAMAQDPDQWAAVEVTASEHGGWIQKGFERALALYQADELAESWYRRFRTSSDWYQAYGSWRLHLDQVDLRHILWDRGSFPPYTLPDARRYEQTFGSMISQACRKRADELKKTRFGIARS